jgi:hypothetical protein
MVAGSNEIEIGPTQPPDPNFKIGPGPSGIPGRPPTGYAHMQPGEVNPTIGRIARDLLNGDWGALTPFRIGNKKYMARVEPHYHEPPPAGADASKYPKPWGWHKGVTIYKQDLSTKKVDDIAEEPNETEEATPSNGGRMKLLERIDKFLGSIK